MTTVESRQSDAEQRFWALAVDVGARNRNPWVAYENLKRQFVVARPDATPREYEAAMARIALLCGV